MFRFKSKRKQKTFISCFYIYTLQPMNFRDIPQETEAQRLCTGRVRIAFSTNTGLQCPQHVQQSENACNQSYSGREQYTTQSHMLTMLYWRKPALTVTMTLYQQLWRSHPSAKSHGSKTSSGKMSSELLDSIVAFDKCFNEFICS